MHIEIQKVEISSRIFLKWDYEEQKANVNTKVKASSDAIIHEDLSSAIQALVPHFVLLTEMRRRNPEIVKAIDLKDIPEELLKKYIVKGISIDDNKGDTKYKISGCKILGNGKVVNFDTPGTTRGSDDNEYEFFDKLEQQVERIKDEVLEYMQGKHGVSNQTSMFDEDDFDPTDNAEEDGVKEFIPAEEVA